MIKIKSLLLFIIALLMFVGNCQATELNRSEANNYGVNKKWKVSGRNKSNVMDTPYVDADDKIYDYANILTEEEELYLKELINKFVNKYKMDLVIYTVDIPYAYDEYNETLASDFYDYNDFGIDYEHYDGVVLYRNSYDDDPYYDMYTFGNAQLHFNQSIYDRILDSIYPLISIGQYQVGFESWILSVGSNVALPVLGEYKNAYIDKNGFIQYKYVPPYFIAFVLALVSSVVTVFVFIGKNKMVRSALKADTYLDISTINYTNKENIFVTSRTSSYTVSSSSGSSGGGRSRSSSGSSGGGHSRGGGRHG